MGKRPAVIGFSRPEDFEATKKTVADHGRRDHGGHPGARNTLAPPHIRWGKVVTAWSSGAPNSITLRPCFADGTAIPGVKTDGSHDSKIYLVWPPAADPGDMTSILPADTLLPWVPFLVILNEEFEGLSAISLDRNVAVTKDDTTPGVLVDKLLDSQGSALTAIVNPGANEQLKLPDERVKASSDDPSSGYLDAKVKNSIEEDSEELQLVGDSSSPGNSKYYGTDTGGTKGFHSYLDEKVKASSDDPTADYLDAKVKNSIEEDSEQLQLVNDSAAPGNSKYYGTSSGGVKGFHGLPAGDGKVKVTSNDSTPNYLLSKLANGDAISITEVNDGGDEDARVAVVIHTVTEESGVAVDDEVLIYDLSGTAIRRMTVANFIVGYLKLLGNYNGAAKQVFGQSSGTLAWLNTSSCP